jgi:hypothetical protein
MAIIENRVFPKLTGEDARIFEERAAARKAKTNGAELKQIRKGLWEALEFLSGSSKKKDLPSE